MTSSACARAGGQLAGLLSRTEDRLAEVVDQPVEELVVLLADVLLQLAVGLPRNIPGDRERPRIRTRIGHRGLVVQRVLVRPREPLYHVQLVGVRMAEVVEPRILVEADDVDDKRVALPAADRVSE